ncbi:hypothetical protein [Streptomyces caniscabiei]|uniref:Secreted protein n=1 Tax=Streptomyces caniscabiei TaxID=2746961 RepID=A0A927L479_9ACTN|nr:hypothetical protein [Streptomyces caniscabiei]MBD9725212.1 hypothetical protein [Streptomyces caniscabiei]MDX3510762.1 hypothetical protein [Streptomyces caniscabiei]MDX3720295.1 hypothetical protein [Streptomyces caniscabiei]MDX3729460.1 hypothetical protein [Streptomyces caniscabiei]WEO29394.1 hypothetical protein IHE65_42945 [Streptomyces caniscabiei]
MPKHTRTRTLTALAVAGLTALSALAAGAVPAAAAKAGTAPKYLSASQLPPHPSSSWTAGGIEDGLPEELQYCLGDALLAYDINHRSFRTDLETSARQTVVVTGGDSKAKALAARLNKDFRDCVSDSSDPDVEAEYRDLGTLPVEEGARVHGVATVTSWGAMDIRLLSVGRDGRTVTVVDWGQMGGFEDAPVKAFKKTTTTAVNKLY